MSVMHTALLFLAGRSSKLNLPAQHQYRKLFKPKKTLQLKLYRVPSSSPLKETLPLVTKEVDLDGTVVHPHGYALRMNQRKKQSLGTWIESDSVAGPGSPSPRVKTIIQILAVVVQRGAEAIEVSPCLPSKRM